jgi:phosphoglycerate dehydrogenase-like enzyme/glyoxylase-like metal-dependent hydrolase (beta-lactamase superfamily II)
VCAVALLPSSRPEILLMKTKPVALLGAWVCLLAALVPVRADDALPQMKFNEVKEIAPGVFFRYSSISATDQTVPFGGSNNIWVVFNDYVFVFDANFPKEAGDVIAAIKKTTDKPIRYVLDSHHHGDHAYGNAVFGQAGATVVAQANCARLLRTTGPKEFADAGRGAGGRKDVRESRLKAPDLIFDDKLVFEDEDGKQRVELYFFGHAHTPGDAVLYLPRHKILCTGDACVNGAFNFMGHSDSASWIRVLERMQQLNVKMVCPGHGPVAGKDLLDRQKRYFVELRQQVKKGIDGNLDVDAVIKAIDMPWYKDWTGVTPPGDNIKHVYAELTGRITPPDLVEDFGVYEGPSPTKDTPGWTKPRRIVVPNLMPARLAELKRLAPDIEFIPVKTARDAARAVEDADAVLSFCTPEIVLAGKKLRWIQVPHVGVENDLSPELVGSPIVLTNIQRLSGPQVADQAFALLLGLTRGLRETVPRVRGQGNVPAYPGAPKFGPYVQGTGGDREAVPAESGQKPRATLHELNGKTMLVVGLGGIGTQIARRAEAFGMRVMAVDPKDMERPKFVFSLDKPAKLLELLPVADVVVLACPLTGETRGMIGEAQLRAMKPSAYLINVARGGLVQTSALVEALEKKRLAGAGMDVTDPEPLPQGHPLWKMTNVLISPHVGAGSPEGQDRQWRLFRENVRRFVAGEPLLCVVDKAKGY